MITEADLQTLITNQARAASGPAISTEPMPAKKRRGCMNKLEERYMREVLERDKRSGGLLWYDFEPIKLRLADGAWYTPDFAVQGFNGWLEIHEVKGFWREAARVRIKVAAEKYPYRFVAVTHNRKTGEWEYERFYGRRL